MDVPVYSMDEVGSVRATCRVSSRRRSPVQFLNIFIGSDGPCESLRVLFKKGVTREGTGGFY